MNILIVMAGEGSRLKGLEDRPKPLISIGQKTMIETCLDSLGLEGNFIFVTRNYENLEFNKTLNHILEKHTKKSNIIQIDELTEGPVCSALKAEILINNDTPLIVTNCDLVMEWDGQKFQKFLAKVDSDAVMVTYPESTEANSYIKLDENGYGTELKEKEVISEHSLNGIHYFKKGQSFVGAAKELIRKNIRINDEFYISMAVNEYIKMGGRVSIYEIDKSEHWPVGLVSDVEKYLEHINEKS